VIILKARFIFLFITLPIFGIGINLTRHFDTPAFLTTAPRPTFIIDAGHGGEDGGAVSVTGVSESQINLSIARKLEEILVFCGQIPEMTRREDISLHDPDANTLREKKVSDLHNRVAIIEEHINPIVLSIHQNSYPESRYRGAQIFFAPTPRSSELAHHVQTIFSASLAQTNTRESKQIPGSVYLMNHISCPAVLIECGFLSNPEEEHLLRQESYQRKLAACLASAVLTFPVT